MFEWIKDKSYYRKKANTIENAKEFLTMTFEQATMEWSRQLVEKNTEIDSLKKQLIYERQKRKEEQKKNRESERPKKRK